MTFLTCWLALTLSFLLPMRQEVLDALRSLGYFLVTLDLRWNGLTSGSTEIGLFFALCGILTTEKMIQTIESGDMDLIISWCHERIRIFIFMSLFLWITCVVTWMQREGILWGERARESERRWEMACAIGFCENILMAVRIERDPTLMTFDLPPSPLGHIWFLSMEMQYSIVSLIFTLLVVTFNFPGSIPFPWKRASINFEENGGFKLPIEIEHSDSKRRESVCNSHRTLRLLLIGQIIFTIFSALASHSVLTQYGSTAAYFSSLSHFREFAVGGITLLSFRLFVRGSFFLAHSLSANFLTELCTLICAILMIVSLFIPSFSGNMTSHFIYESLFLLAFSLSAIMSSQNGTKPPKCALLTRLFAHPNVTFIGVISYSFYLWHWPLSFWFRHWTHHLEPSSYSAAVALDTDKENTTPFLSASAIVLASWMLAYATHSLSESIFLTLRYKQNRKQILLSVVLFLILTAFLAWASTSAPTHKPMSLTSTPTLWTATDKENHPLPLSLSVEGHSASPTQPLSHTLTCNFPPSLLLADERVRQLCDEFALTFVNRVRVQRSIHFENTLRVNRLFRNHTKITDRFSNRKLNPVISTGPRLSGYLSADTNSIFIRVTNESCEYPRLTLEEGCPIHVFAQKLPPFATLFVCYQERYLRKICGLRESWKCVTLFWIISDRFCSEDNQG